MLNCAARCERISCSWRGNVRGTIKARARHRLHVVDESFKAQILAARKIFSDNLPEDLQGAVEQFAQDNYIASAFLQDNILFGKLAYGHDCGTKQVGAAIANVVTMLNVR
jgi:putative ABC transport system ATP-binding protein